MQEQQPLVLVANDDDAMRDALQFVLQLENFVVHVHRSGVELVADCDLGRADCLILKDRMPNMGGLEVMQYLRSRQIFLPAILLTANATPRLHQQAAAVGIGLVLEKPILDNALLDGVLRILHHGNPPDARATT